MCELEITCQIRIPQIRIPTYQQVRLTGTVSLAGRSFDIQEIADLAVRVHMTSTKLSQMIQVTITDSPAVLTLNEISIFLGYKSLLAKIEGLEKEMKEMKTNLARGFTAVMTALKKNEKKGTMSPNEAAYHQDIVKKKFPNLPCDTVHKVFWLNTALEDINLSTSTVSAIK